MNPGKRPYYSFLYAVGMLLPLAASNATAQEAQAADDGKKETKPDKPEDSQAKTLGRIVVAAPEVQVNAYRAARQESATKSQMSVRETPQAISVITRESIDERQSMDLASAVELSAGVVAAGKAFAGRDSRTGENFTLRGQELDSGRDLRIDGFTSGGDRNFYDLAPFERVEVVKGPSSMLYGQGSLGGFINLVPKKPRADGDVSLVAQAGSYDTYRAEVDVTGALNGEQTLVGLASLAYEDSGSFIDGVDSKRFVVAPSLEWQIGERTRALAQVIYQDDSFHPSMGIALLERDGKLVMPDVPRSFFFGVPNSEASKASSLHTSLKVDHEVSDRWLATLMLHKSRNRLLGIADSYGYGLDDYGNTALYSSYVAHDNDNWAGELRLDGKFDAFGQEHQLLVGVEKNKLGMRGHGGGGYPYIGTANIYDGSLDSAPSVPGHSNPQNYEARTTGGNEAIYTQLLLGLREGTRLLLGARYDRSDKHDVFNSFDFGSSEQSQDDSDITTRIGVTHDFGKNITAYVVRAESFNPVFGRTWLDGLLEPETGTGLEVGAKGEWLEGRFGATVALFRQELDNRPIPDTNPDVPPGQDFMVSAGLQRNEGLELELTGEPVTGWKLAAAASWLDAEYIDRDDPNFGLTPGGTIKRQLALHTSYELQSGPLRGLGLGATVLSVGERIVLASEHNLVVEGYERLDLHVAYDASAQLKLALLLRNVTDETYIERPNSAYLYGHFFGAPRSVLLRAEYAFGL